MKKKIFGNVAAQLLGKLATSLTTLLVTILVTRAFGPAGYGQLTIMLTYPALFYLMADFGLNIIFIRDYSQPENLKENFANLLGWRLVWSLFLVTTAGVILVFLPYSSPIKLGISLGLLTIVAQALYTSANAIFQTKLRYLYSTIAVVVAGVTVLGGVLSFILFKREELWLIPAIYTLGGVVLVITSLLGVRRLLGNLAIKLERKKIVPLILATLPLGLAAVFSVIEGKVDHFLLSLLKPAASLGYYAAAYKVFEVVLVLPTFFMNAAYPLLARYLATSQKDFARVRRLSLLTLVVGGFVTAIVGYLAAPTLIRVVAGRDFGPSVRALGLLFAGLPIFFVTSFLFYEIILSRRQFSLAIIYFLGAIFNTTMNLIFIPRYDFYAAAVITGATEALILVLLLLALRRRHVDLSDNEAFVSRGIGA